MFSLIFQVNPHEQFDVNEYEEDDNSQLACREALELLCISIALVPSSVEHLLKENFFEYFLIDLVLYCHYPSIRHTASEQIVILITRCSQGQSENLLTYLIEKQFQIFNKHSNDLKKYSSYSSDFFLLLCRLLSFAYMNQIIPSNIDQQLHDEINWLKNLQLPVDDHLLRGHLNLAKELLQFQASDRKRFYGIDQSLIQQLIEQFLFPASTSLHQFRSLKQRRLSQQSNHNEDIELKEPPIPICQTPMTTSAAFDLLVILGTNCIDNLKLIDQYITDLFYSGKISNHE
jgi:ubiquitin carboxyl-terminal hydrolase 9/24